MSLVIIVSLPFLVWIYFYELVSQDILSISDTAGVIRSICNIKKILIPRLPGLETGRRTLWPHRKKPHRPGWRCGTLCRIGFEDLKRQQLFHDQIFQPSFISFINEISFVEIYRYFTPRTRKGCDVNDFYHLLFMFLISIHAPVKGATKASWIPWPHSAYFNPRTREGCDAITKEQSADALDISIHAPVKGATPDPLPEAVHALRFQSTHPWRVRQQYGQRGFYHQRISIHAPVKGATGNGQDASSFGFKFQSTHPWRVRRGSFSISSPAMSISIHAPVKGATCWRPDALRRYSYISIHAPVKGATVDRYSGRGPSSHFNPRTREGCDYILKKVLN